MQLYCLGILILCLMTAGPVEPVSASAIALEYSYEQACKDWAEIPARITAIGARHSPFHAAVYADGTVTLAGTENTIRAGRSRACRAE